MNMRLILGAWMTLLCLAPATSAQDAAAKGLEIAKEAKRRDTGYGDFIVSATLILQHKQGQKSVRQMNVKTIESGAAGEKSLIIFTAPADTKDTALLSYSYKTKPDDQWLFLPSIKRVKRIASGNKTGSFVGSEFSYEDISPQQVEKYTYKWIRDEKFFGRDCFVVERYPKDPKSGYTKQVIWMDKAEYRPWKVENYDRKKSLLKTLLAAKYQQYEGKFWRPDVSVMTNHQTGKKTTITYTGYKFRTGLKQSDFGRSVLDQIK